MQAVATIRSRRGKLTAGLISLVALVTSMAIPMSQAAALSIGGPSDCDANAIVHCGVHSTAAIQSAYNSDPYVQSVYHAFGITHNEIGAIDSTAVAGRVTRSGEVFVDGQSSAVATGAVTGGRQDIAGSTRVVQNGHVFYRRAPSVSFQQASVPAFVSMANGRFQYAIIASCGNAVSASPVSSPAPAPAPAPAPTPAPAAPTAAPQQSQAQVQAQSQSQSQQVVVNQAPAQTTTQQSQAQGQAQQQAGGQGQGQAQAQSQAQSTQTSAAAAAPAPAPATAPAAQTLPNTGPGSLAAVFGVTTAGGFYAYRRFLTRRLG